MRLLPYDVEEGRPEDTDRPTPPSHGESGARPSDHVSPTAASGTGLAWKIEEKAYFAPERGPARIVHRGTCHTNHDYAAPPPPPVPRRSGYATTGYGEAAAP